MKVGVTRNTSSEAKFAKYLDWLRSFNPAMELLVLSTEDRPAKETAVCDGVVLTGGGDIDPALYGRQSLAGQAMEVRKERDEFEFEVLGSAFEQQIPVLGICRGLQVVNVFLGGTLFVDLELSGFRNHEQIESSENRHAVTLTPGTLLAKHAGTGHGEVNSYHHQAAEQPGKGLIVSARAEEGVIEGMEWIEGGNHSPLVLVQWHPERMERNGNSLRDAAGLAFIDAVKIRKSRQPIHN